MTTTNRDERLALLSIAMFAFDNGKSAYAHGVFDTIAHVLHVKPVELANVLGVDYEAAPEKPKKASKVKDTSTKTPKGRDSDGEPAPVAIDDPVYGEEAPVIVHYPSENNGGSACGRAKGDGASYTEDVRGVTCKRCVQTNVFQRALNAWLKDNPEAAETVA